MGATTFFTTSKGATPAAAFGEARARAQYDHGHSGYTGTIAEKSAFTMFGMDPAFKDAFDYAHHLIDARDARIDDKWGPAGCIQTAKDTYLFFGWASE